MGKCLHMRLQAGCVILWYNFNRLQLLKEKTKRRQRRDSTSDEEEDDEDDEEEFEELEEDVGLPRVNFDLKLSKETKMCNPNILALW